MGEELESGLEGLSDSGSDFYDIPAPELPAGVEKTLVRQAVGVLLKRPQHGDEVQIHYVGRRTDGSVFDSTSETSR